MKFEVITGTASNFNQASDFSYVPNPVGNAPVAVKQHLFSFRLDNKPVLFRTQLFPSIDNGDRIAAVGVEKDGNFQIAALRNISTGAGYYPSTSSATTIAWVITLLGVPFIAIMVGFLIIAYGIFLLVKVGKLKKAYRQLQELSF